MQSHVLRLGTGVASALLLAVSAQPAAAQANELPPLIHACYVPNTGTIYRIKTEDTKDNCNSNKHIEFSWSQEGTLDHSELINLDQDDHLQYLLTEGVRNSPAGFAVTGTFTESGTPPVSGPGTRLMWFPEQAAFRAGQVDGTEWDPANIGSGSVAMGRNNIASGQYSTAMGIFSTASGARSTAMGNATTASGQFSTALGSSTTASGNSSTAIGGGVTASGDNSFAIGGAATTASGLHSRAMGVFITASGDFSTGIGSRASTNNHSGAFVYGDNSTLGPINAIADNQFVVRAQRIWLGTDNNVTATTGRYLETSTGAFLSTGGSWTNASSRAAKENFRAVDAEEVLRRVAALEVQSWNYRSDETGVRHVGPVAQDFYHAFGLGGTEKAISTVDLGGVNMLAIQALERRTTELREKTDRIERLEAEVVELRAARAEIERRLADIESLLRR